MRSLKSLQVGSSGSLLLAITIALVIITNLPFKPDSRLAGAIQNFGHAPLFGVASILIARMFRRSSAGGFKHYWLALGYVILLGAATELIQRMLGGDAEWQDIATDLAGAAAFLAVYWGFTTAATKAWRLAAMGAAAFILALAAIPLVNDVETTRQRNLSFPLLVDFNSERASQFCTPRNASLAVIPAPDSLGLPQGMRMAKITFKPAQYPGFAINEPYPDWTGYKELRFLVYSELEAQKSLVIRIHDAHHNNQTADRYNAPLAVKPGLNQIRISLQDVEMAPKGRRMDMRAIRSLVIFAVSPSKPFALFLGDIRLAH
jgi:hypothetical protein